MFLGRQRKSPWLKKTMHQTTTQAIVFQMKCHQTAMTWNPQVTRIPTILGRRAVLMVMIAASTITPVLTMIVTMAMGIMHQWQVIISQARKRGSQSNRPPKHQQKHQSNGQAKRRAISPRMSLLPLPLTFLI